jgi:hypothetical protein
MSFEIEQTVGVIHMHCLNIEGLIVGKANSAPLTEESRETT